MATPGPSRPQTRVPVPDHVDQLPIYQMPRAARLWIVGAHGGAGESTLSALSPDWEPACHGWPTADPSAPAHVLVVARSNSDGLHAAQRAARQWASGAVPGVTLLGLATVADAPGRLPKQLREMRQVIAGGFPRTWHLPWVEAYRLGTPPEQPSRQLRALLSDVEALLTSETP